VLADQARAERRAARERRRLTRALDAFASERWGVLPRPPGRPRP
jgi:hypothetical protein